VNCIIIGPAYPLRGGLASYNERLCRAFIEEGHSCRIITYSLQYPGFLFPGKSQYSDQPAPKDISIEAIVNSINPFNWLSVGKKIRKENPDLVIFRYWMPFMGPCQGTIARQIRKNGHTRIVAITDNIIPHEKFPLGKMLTRYFVRSCDAFVTMSKKVLADLSAIAPTKPAVFIPHPLYDNFGAKVERTAALKAIGLDPAFRYFLFFGFIRKYKGLDILLQAFADERLRKFPVKLIIAGEYYEDAAPYKDLIARLNLGEHVVQRNDFIPDDEVRNYFSASDFIVQTYRSATQSGVTQVAYHFEKPMLVTDVGGLSEMVPHGKVGYVVPVNEKAVADAFVDFLEKDRKDEFLSGILEEKKKYSWKAMVAGLMEQAGIQ
jgi:D-inositol-3-phosphate glycosyltransferase